jgi:hypothetical protein
VSAAGLLAAVLASEGLSFVLVGSAAMELRGVEIDVHDVDVVVEPSKPNIERLGAVLETLSLSPIALSQFLLAGRSIVSVATSFGALDCMLERGRKDWWGLREKASWLDVAGVPVLVASLADARALRARYKAT